MKNGKVPATGLSEATTTSTGEEVNSHDKNCRQPALVYEAQLSSWSRNCGSWDFGEQNFAVAPGCRRQTYKRRCCDPAVPGRSRDHRKRPGCRSRHSGEQANSWLSSKGHCRKSSVHAGSSAARRSSSRVAAEYGLRGPPQPVGQPAALANTVASSSSLR